MTEGSQTRDFIYIDDVVSAFDCVISHADKIPFDRLAVFEVGTNVKTSVKDLVFNIKHLFKDNTTKLNFGILPYRKNEVLDYDLNTLSLRMLGWTAKTSLKSGLRKVYEGENK
mgnify:FL=1